MVLWRNDKELFAIAKKELFVALVGDILDTMGFQQQFLPPNIKPLQSAFVVIGRAMPVVEADVTEKEALESENPIFKKPIGIMFEALDDLKEDEVYICSGSSPTFALWGGLMSTRAIKLKAASSLCIERQ
jgi:regulator of RNase E activity RraA